MEIYPDGSLVELSHTAAIYWIVAFIGLEWMSGVAETVRFCRYLRSGTLALTVKRLPDPQHRMERSKNGPHVASLIAARFQSMTSTTSGQVNANIQNFI